MPQHRLWPPRWTMKQRSVSSTDYDGGRRPGTVLVSLSGIVSKRLLNDPPNWSARRAGRPGAVTWFHILFPLIAAHVAELMRPFDEAVLPVRAFLNGCGLVVAAYRQPHGRCWGLGSFRNGSFLVGMLLRQHSHPVWQMLN